MANCYFFTDLPKFTLVENEKKIEYRTTVKDLPWMYDVTYDEKDWTITCISDGQDYYLML